MTKKVFFNGRFLTQPVTGVQRTAYETLLALDRLITEGEIDKEQFDFTVIYSGEMVNSIKLVNIRLLKKGVFKGNLWEQLELPFYTMNRMLVSMCTISALLKRKQIVYVHDASFIANPRFFGLIFRTWYKYAIRWLGKIALHIVTVSDFSKNELVRYAGFIRGKMTVIPNAADHILNFGEPSDGFKDKIDALRPYCLAVSSLGTNKNFRGLSCAIKKIDFKNFNMLIAGGAISTLKSETQEQSVTYLGYVSNQELRYLYSNARLFIFPSFYEGFGIPPLEAMILGCPVVASNTSSLPEILDDSCAYFDPADVDNMAEVISSLISNSIELERLVQQGYVQVTKYSWRNSAFALYRLIGRLT